MRRGNGFAPARWMVSRRMAKCADLHTHLSGASGAVYAGTFPKHAAEVHLYVSVAGLWFDAKHRAPDCPEGEAAASTAPDNEGL